MMSPTKKVRISINWQPFPVVDCSAENGLFSNIKGLTYYRDNEDDPYITLKDVRRLEISHFDCAIHIRLDRTRQKNVKNCKYTTQTT